jgi:hypothetical protein
VIGVDFTVADCVPAAKLRDRIAGTVFGADLFPLLVNAVHHGFS